MTVDTCAFSETIAVPVKSNILLIIRRSQAGKRPQRIQSILSSLSQIVALLGAAGVAEPVLCVDAAESFRPGFHLAGMILVFTERAFAELLRVDEWCSFGVRSLIVPDHLVGVLSLIDCESAPSEFVRFETLQNEDEAWTTNHPCRQLAATDLEPVPWDSERVAAWIARQPNSEADVTADGLVVYTKTLSPGGAERQWVYLAISLFAAGYRTTMVVETVQGNAGHYLPLLVTAGVPVIVLESIDSCDVLTLPSIADAHGLLSAGLFPNADQVLRLAVLIKQLQTRTIFAQLDEPNVVGGIAGLLGGAQSIVLSFRNYNPTNFSYLDSSWFLPIYILLASCPAIRMVGNHVGANEDYARWMEIPAGRVGHIPNGLNEVIFPLADAAQVSDLRSELVLPSNARVLLGIFRLSEEKDPLTFIAVCRKIQESLPNLVVLIAGVGPYSQVMNDEIAGSSLEGQIRFLGRRTDVSALMALSDLMLLTSRQEGMPNVIMEAQLSGLPVVATDVGGVSATLIPNVTGLIRPAGDVDGLADACLRLLKNPYQSVVFGRAGARHARTAFSLETARDRYLRAASL